jgi:FtsP/CotA-like multicopper oxidase with cupredoxin domain
MALAERADVIVDFRGLADGTEIELLNIGPDEPFGGGIPVTDFFPSDPNTTGRVMKFVVNEDLLGASDTDPGGIGPDATDPALLTLNFEPALGAATAAPRQVSLNEEISGDLDLSQRVCVCADADGVFAVPIRQVACGADPAIRCPADFQNIETFGPTAAKLGTVNDPASATPSGNPLMWTDMTGASTPVTVELQNGNFVEVNITENPQEGDIEEWEMFNFTEDAHPIHIHMVRFQVVGRAALEETVVPGVGVEDWETGFKDTVISDPGQRTVVKALFDIPGLFVWHCHIVEHEDNEMMRPYVVSPAAP